MSATLGSVCRFLNGGTPSKAVAEYFEGEIPWISSADISGPVAGFVARNFITDDAIKNSAVNKVAAGTVLLVTRTGVGKVAIAGTELCFSQDITALIPDPAKLDAGYLVHFLRTNKDYLLSLARGATIKGITRNVVSDLAIPLPPIPEQRRIVAILDQADALRAKRLEALAQLDSLTQSIFIDMFGDPATNSATLNLQPLGSLLEESFQNGAYFPKETYCESGGVEMVHMSDAFEGCVRRGQLKRVNCSDEDIKKYSLSTNDILIARRSLTYEGAAKPCMIPASKESLIFESSFIRIRPNNTKIIPIYLFHYLNNERVKNAHIRPYVTKSTISGINQSNLAQVPVMQPPLKLQQEFGMRVQSIEKMQLIQVSSLSVLTELFASLQHRAFQGNL